jgi:hypothetical protein
MSQRRVCQVSKSGRVTGLELLVAASGIAAALLQPEATAIFGSCLGPDRGGIELSGRYGGARRGSRTRQPVGSAIDENGELEHEAE